MKSIFVLLVACLVIANGQSQRTEITFEVFLKEKKIGTLTASEQRSSTTYVRDIKSNTDAKVLIVSVHVEAEVSATHENGSMIKGTAYRHASRGPKDIHAHTSRIGDKKYKCEKDGVTHEIDNADISFCVIDLYFKEPTGIDRVFSNMYAAFIPVQLISPGKYKVTNPDDNETIYTYSRGKLIMVEVDTPAGQVVTRRI